MEVINKHTQFILDLIDEVEAKNRAISQLGSESALVSIIKLLRKIIKSLSDFISGIIRKVSFIITSNKKILKAFKAERRNIDIMSLKNEEFEMYSNIPNMIAHDHMLDIYWALVNTIDNAEEYDYNTELFKMMLNNQNKNLQSGNLEYSVLGEPKIYSIDTINIDNVIKTLENITGQFNRQIKELDVRIKNEERTVRRMSMDKSMSTDEVSKRLAFYQNIHEQITSVIKIILLINNNSAHLLREILSKSDARDDFAIRSQI